MDTVGKTDQAKVYQRKKHILSLASLALTLLMLAVFVMTPLSAVLRDFSNAQTANLWLAVGLYFTLFSLIFFVSDIPIGFYSGYTLEHRYGLSNLSVAGWFGEMLKRQIVGFLFAFFLVELLYAVIRAFPDMWWIISWAAWIVITVVVGKLWPILIAPLFYKYEPLVNQELRSRILELIKTVDLKIENVYSMNLSKTTNKANAYFCGLGRTRRVVLSDTLIRRFTPDEIAVVVAHEAGHCKRQHIWKGILFNTVVSLATFWLAYRNIISLAPTLGIENAADTAGFPLLCLTAVVISILLMPVANMYSRSLEREADDFALTTTRMKEAFVAAMKKLAFLNMADPSPHPLIEFFLYSHPSIQKRIARAEAFQ